jgi:hypothetical protein
MARFGTTLDALFLIREHLVESEGRPDENSELRADVRSIEPIPDAGLDSTGLETILCFLVAFRSGLRELLLVTSESSQHPDPRKHRRPTDVATRFRASIAAERAE